MSFPDRGSSPHTYPQRCAAEAVEEIRAEIGDHGDTAGESMCVQAAELLEEQAQTTDPAALLRWTMQLLRQARDLAKRAKAAKATERIRAAISSTEGAIRHAELKASQEE